MRKKPLVYYEQEVVRNSPNEHLPLWYAMKIAAAKSYPMVLQKLQQSAITYFFPIDTLIKQGADQKRIKVDSPVLGNYIFCKASEVELVDIVNTPGLPLIFYYPRISTDNRRVIIDEDEMQQFIRFATSENLHPRFITIEQAHQETAGGKRIRFTNGIFKGVEATVSTRRTHRRRIVLTLANQMAMTVEIGDNETERVNESPT